LVVLQAESRVLELLNHLPVAEPAEVAPLRLAARVVREFLGERREVLARARALENVLGLLARGLRVELRVLGEVVLNLLVGRLELRLGELRLVNLVEGEGLLQLYLQLDGAILFYPG